MRGEVRKREAIVMWRGSVTVRDFQPYKEGVRIMDCVTVGLICVLMFPSLGRAEKLYSSNPPMIAKFVWPPEGNYCLLPPNPGIRCRIMVMDYDEFSLRNNQGMTLKNLEETNPSQFQIHWMVVPKEAGSFSHTSGWNVVFYPNPYYNGGKGGKVTLVATIMDNDALAERQDPTTQVVRTINLVPKPAIHQIGIEVITCDDTVILRDIPISSGESTNSKVKLRLTGIAALPTPFYVTSEEWLTPWGKFTNNPIITDIINHNESHKNVKIIYTFTWENSVTGETGADSKSFEVPICFWRGNAFDEWLNSPRGYTQLGNVYHEPPNWFDARPKHWADVVTELKENFVYYRHSYPDSVSLFDWSGEFDPLGESRLEYRGRVYVFSTAATWSGEDDYRLTARGIDLCGSALLHEIRHKIVFEAAWGGYTDSHLKFPDGRWKPFSGEPGVDRDADGISDDYEKANESSGWHYDDQFGMHKWFDGYPGPNWITDLEFDAIIRGEYNYICGSNDLMDWCHDGKQSWLFAWW